MNTQETTMTEDDGSEEARLARAAAEAEPDPLDAAIEAAEKRIAGPAKGEVAEAAREEEDEAAEEEEPAKAAPEADEAPEAPSRPRASILEQQWREMRPPRAASRGAPAYGGADAGEVEKLRAELAERNAQLEAWEKAKSNPAKLLRLAQLTDEDFVKARLRGLSPEETYEELLELRNEFKSYTEKLQNQIEEQNRREADRKVLEGRRWFLSEVAKEEEFEATRLFAESDPDQVTDLAERAARLLTERGYKPTYKRVVQEVEMYLQERYKKLLTRALGEKKESKSSAESAVRTAKKAVARATSTAGHSGGTMGVSEAVMHLEDDAELEAVIKRQALAYKRARSG